MASFWGVVFLKKGNSLHKKVGVVYFFSICMIFISSLLNTFLVIGFPKVLRSELKIDFIYSHFPFLLLANYLCFAPTFVGFIAFFNNPQTVKKLTSIAKYIIYSQVFFALLITVYSVIQKNIFLFLLSTIFSVYSARREYKNIMQLRLNQNILTFSDKLRIHMVSVIAGGIALHIGFAAGGVSTRYFKNPNSTLHLMLLTAFAYAFMFFFQDKIYTGLGKKYSKPN